MMPISVSVHRDKARIARTLNHHQRRVFPRAVNLAIGRTTDRLYTQWTRRTSQTTGIQRKKLTAKYTGRLMKFFRTDSLGERVGRLWLGGKDLTFNYIGVVTKTGKLSKRGREMIGTAGGVPFKMPVRPGSSKTILAVRLGDSIMTGINIFEVARKLKDQLVRTLSGSIFTEELQSQLLRLSRGKIRRG